MPPSPGTHWIGGCEVPQVGRNAAAKGTCSCTSGVVHCNILTGLWAGQSAVRFLAGAACLSLPHNMQSGSEAHSAFSLVGALCSLVGSKAAGPFIYSPSFQFCPYRVIFGKNDHCYWKLTGVQKTLISRRYKL
jgi:hypothetical protein